LQGISSLARRSWLRAGIRGAAPPQRELELVVIQLGAEGRPRGQEATVVILEEIGELRVEAVTAIDDRD